MTLEMSPTKEFRWRDDGEETEGSRKQLGPVSKPCHQAARRHKRCQESATKLSSQFHDASGTPEDRDLSSKLVLAFTFHPRSHMVTRLWILPKLAVISQSAVLLSHSQDREVQNRVPMYLHNSSRPYWCGGASLHHYSRLLISQGQWQVGHSNN